MALENSTSYSLGRASQVTLVVKIPAVNAGDIKDMGLIHGLGIIPWRRARLKQFIMHTYMYKMIYRLLLLLSHVSRVRLCATPYKAAHQAPIPGSLQARIWSGLPPKVSNK